MAGIPLICCSGNSSSVIRVASRVRKRISKITVSSHVKVISVTFLVWVHGSRIIDRGPILVMLYILLLLFRAERCAGYRIVMWTC